MLALLELHTAEAEHLHGFVVKHWLLLTSLPNCFCF